jgi:hypothetical protein
VELFTVFSWCLAIVATATVMWPLNVPVMALAYKIRQGYQPVPFTTSAFWLRSTFAAFGLFVLCLALLALDYALVEGAELPPGPVHLMLLLLYLPAGTWFVFWAMACDDMLQGLSVFVIFMLLTGVFTLLLGRVTGYWHGLAREAPWLFPS